MYAAIDFGISNTDVVAHAGDQWHHWTRPSEGRPTPELVRTVLATGGAELSSLHQLAVTGGRHRLLPGRINSCPVIHVGEIEAIGRGGQALAGLSETDAAKPILVASAGSGTAMVEARGDRYTHITGTGVGGGTLLGLGHLLLHTTDPNEINELAQQGDPNGADLSLSDVVSGPIGHLPADATAVNFGRLAHQDLDVCREDLAAALVTLVGQVIAIVAINAARARQLEQVIVTGHLIDMSSMRAVLRQVGAYYGLHFTLPRDAGYGTALGALLSSVTKADQRPEDGSTKMGNCCDRSPTAPPSPPTLAHRF